jgi:hypothetical protein
MRIIFVCTPHQVDLPILIVEGREFFDDAPFDRPFVLSALAPDAGEKAVRRFVDFFGSVANDNTLTAFQRACQSFFGLRDERGPDELAAIESIQFGVYIRAMGEKFERPTVKQHLAAIRTLFDYLVADQIGASSPPTPCAAKSTSSNVAKTLCARQRTPASLASRASGKHQSKRQKRSHYSHANPKLFSTRSPVGDIRESSTICRMEYRTSGQQLWPSPNSSG